MTLDRYVASFEVAIEAMTRLPTMPFVELNPDGQDQARESMKTVAREGLIALGVLADAIADDSERLADVLRRAHTAIGDWQEEETGDDEVGRIVDEWNAAREWVESNWTQDGEEWRTLAEVLVDIKDWGDQAWHTAGKAEERQLEIVGVLRMVGGMLEFEANVAGALRMIHDTLAHSPKPLMGMVAVDPSFADWTPDCWRCHRPIGDWRNAWMLPTSEIPDDEPNGVCFVHRNCNPGVEGT